MARVDDLTAQEKSTYEGGYLAGYNGTAASTEERDINYWQGFVMGRLSRGWAKAEESRDV